MKKIEVEPVVHAMWKFDEATGRNKCSNCGALAIWNPRIHEVEDWTPERRCHNCGAKMKYIWETWK